MNLLADSPEESLNSGSELPESGHTVVVLDTQNRPPPLRYSATSSPWVSQYLVGFQRTDISLGLNLFHQSATTAFLSLFYYFASAHLPKEWGDLWLVKGKLTVFSTQIPTLTLFLYERCLPSTSTDAATTPPTLS